MRAVVPVLLCVCFTLPVLAQPRVVPSQPTKPLFDINDWTPRPALGQAELWEKRRDPEWDDARFLSMDTGPAFNGTMKYLNGSESVPVYKATAVRFGAGEAGVIFDRATLRLAAGWTGGYLQQSPKRFGLLHTPTPVATARMVFSSTSAAGWADDKAVFALTTLPTAPLPAERMKYLGHYLHDDRVTFSYTVSGVAVLDTVKFVKSTGGSGGFLRTLQIAPSDKALSLRVDDKRVSPLAASKKSRVIFLSYGDTGDAKADDVMMLGKAGSAQAKPLQTKLERGVETGPFAVDTLTIPYENPHKALFFCTGLDFLPDGRIAMCTCHGDVWTAKIDEKASTVTWVRYATGLAHPLGLKVVDGKVLVLESGQLTRLHDSNEDGQADFYECFCNAWHTGAGEHAYDTCLECDPDGHFYFFKTGDTDLPHGGCLLKVAKDGGKVEIAATGVRHPIGLGISPKGIITGADQEGNWMPATRIDQYKPGGFYGDMRAHHRTVPPRIYDAPLCWLPREVDNSAGGQVWVPENAFGPLAGLPLHFSYGRCRPYVLLRQEFADGTVQGGVSTLPIEFLSGSCRGRFDKNGDLFVCGLNGWQTAARADGSLQRVRYTGKPLDTVVKMEAVSTGLKLTFTRPLDPKTAEVAANYKAAWWNYRWSADYGSKRWSVANPNVEGQDNLLISSAKLLDEKTVLVTLAGGLKPVMQLQLGYNIAGKDAKPISGSVYATIHKFAKD